MEYPLLGEPPVVEFINTLYSDPDGGFDFLATVELARGWFRALEPSILSGIDLLDEAARCDLVELRSAIRAVTEARDLTAVVSSIAVLESAANRSPARIELSPRDAGVLNVDVALDLSQPAGTIALLARAAINIAAQTSPGPVLICDRPACNMRYLQHHRRRRYCNPRCANTDRQTRFQQRHKN